MEEPGGRRGRDDRGGGHLDLRALRRRAAGELDVQLRGAGQRAADRPGGLGPGDDPQRPAPAGAHRPSGPAAAARIARRGPWHPATHLELLHAAPAFTVVGVGLAFGLVAGRHDLRPGRLALLAGLLLCNQYAAGALNDAVDAPADAAADRGKPIQTGAISRRTVAVLAVAAGVASLGFGLALGPATFALAVIGLACAWGYDLWLKGTAASALPFALAVPLVPLFGYGAAGRFPPVLWWAWPIGALLAVAVNLADSLPDVERDRATGVQGLAVRLGARRAALLAGACYAAALLVALGSGLAAGERPVVVAGVALAGVLGVAAMGRLPAADPAARRVGYRLLLAGMVALAVGWAAAVRP
jgi:4-hydroxybenzoate polyprenyltransferase